jgi:hypothetical protein
VYVQRWCEGRETQSKQQIKVGDSFLIFVLVKENSVIFSTVMSYIDAVVKDRLHIQEWSQKIRLPSHCA